MLGYGLGARVIVWLWFRFGIVGSNRNQTTPIPNTALLDDGVLAYRRPPLYVK